MTTHTRARPASAPAYYLGHPAGLWLAALTRKQPCRAGAVTRAPAAGRGR
jgi:hypothetical protein